ncbi:hypothetical protein GYMLUDRAFT_57355 [Collybiopsis luxurians FD-317 M1]|uniref:Uncharacterized protein n=1 Tax=Collybiopsis luxurians FD-317 M1 TaxID=944289 RepID=A0A0D0C6C5_9AGAR|nr:hypothetical protein GYMLUDRAFT_57355 [Collybiopsis luxurians FD-317 M1]
MDHSETYTATNTASSTEPSTTSLLLSDGFHWFSRTCDNMTPENSASLDSFYKSVYQAVYVFVEPSRLRYEESIFSDHEMSSIQTTTRRSIYKTSLETHIDDLHNELERKAFPILRIMNQGPIRSLFSADLVSGQYTQTIQTYSANTVNHSILRFYNKSPSVHRTYALFSVRTSKNGISNSNQKVHFS